MLYPVVGIRNENEADYDTYYPWVYSSSGWKRCHPAVYDGGWHYMGDTLWLQWHDSDGKDIVDSNGNPIYVRMKEVGGGRDTHDMTRQEILETFYPIGAIYMSLNATNPNQLFGGTWQAIEGRFLLGANSSYAADSTGGEATHILTTNETPAHTHTRGTMNITGSLLGVDGAGSMAYNWGFKSGTNGAFTVASGGTTYNKYNGAYTCSSYNQTANFDASKSWTGATSSVGGGAAHNNMPPYLAVYMWRRTA